LAINVTDGKLFFNQSGTIKVLANATYATSVSTISFGTTGLTPSTATNGVVTVAGTLAVVNGGTGVTTSTGTGNVVLSTSPTLTTPVISSLSSASATALTLQSAGTTAITVDTSQKVGIGTTSPNRLLSLYATQPVFQITNVASGNTQGTIQYQVSGATDFILDNQGSGSGGNIIFQQAGAERMRINTSGNVGIGTSSPTVKLDVRGTSNTAASTIQIVGNSVSSLLLGQNADGGVIRGQGGNNALTFWTGGLGDTGAGQSGSENMRIDSSGNLLVGTTTDYSTGKVVSYAGTSPNPTSSPPVGFSYVAAGSFGGGYLLSDTGAGGGSQKAAMWLQSGAFYIGTATTGAMTQGVYLANAGTSWTSASDERIKENLIPITDAINKVLTLRSVTGNYISDVSKKSRSFLIAQDVQKVLPEAVATNNPDELGLSYTEVIPLLVAAIKEQQALITQLTTRLTALENK
jgi:hypothetical protein